MFKGFKSKNLVLQTGLMLACMALSSFSTVLGQTTTSPRPSQAKPSSSPAPQPAKKASPPVFHELPKRVLPAMDKPFGMPGVVGLRDGSWQGTDYLGHVSDAISVSIEIVTSDNYEGSPINSNSVTSIVSDMLRNSNITPQADVKEGPPLPFIHVLIFVYPLDQEKNIVYGAIRLFEQVQVMRKNFAPAGYWQAITWESQDMILSKALQTPSDVNEMAQRLVTIFLNRYKLYNPGNEQGLPPPPANK